MLPCTVCVANIPLNLSRETIENNISNKLIIGTYQIIYISKSKAGQKCAIKLFNIEDVPVALSKLRHLIKGQELNTYILPTKQTKNTPLMGNSADQNIMNIEEPRNSCRPWNVLRDAHDGIMQELQCKYTGLYTISVRTDNKLLESIAEIVLKRLKDLITSNPPASKHSYYLTNAYRRMHPHFGDFQMILSALHKIEDSLGDPRTQLNEKDLMAVILNTYTYNNLPLGKVKQACDKYSDRILKKVTEHINQLKTEAGDVETEEEVARRRVREEMQNLCPYLPYLIKQVINNRLVPDNIPNHNLVIYGEPNLPNMDEMRKLLAKYEALEVRKSKNMFNSVFFVVPATMTREIMAVDGTIIDGNKLVIRQLRMALYNLPERMVKDMDTFFEKYRKKK